MKRLITLILFFLVSGCTVFEPLLSPAPIVQPIPTVVKNVKHKKYRHIVKRKLDSSTSAEQGSVPIVNLMGDQSGAAHE
jgi:hypothetical protein